MARSTAGMARGLALVALLLSIASGASASRSLKAGFLDRLFAPLAGSKNETAFTGEVWALLIAGSAGWGNYRHQADVYHAYQVLRRGGLDDDHIVVFHTNDLAGNFMNPHPGQIFNRPGGEDVYRGVPLDYTGEHVTAQNFLDVLLGRPKPAALGTSGKIIKSGPKDRVFIYYADAGPSDAAHHGAPGILGMPTGDFLYADQLLKTLKQKGANKGFADLVLYVEACESGSMFEGLLSDDLNIYATTAANSVESSWGTYCPGMHPSPPPEFTTCLGDLYSVAFLENCDAKDLTAESLEKQYELIKRRTSNNFTYQQGSHVMQFGDLTIDAEPVADYLGDLNTGGFFHENRLAAAEGAPQGAVPQRDADLLHLEVAHRRAAPGAAKAAALAALNAEVSKRAAVDSAVRAATSNLLQQPAVLAILQEKYAATNLLLPALGAANGPLPAPIVEQFVSAPLPRAAGAALVDDWDCLRAMMGAWQSACGPLDQYGMQYSRLFANLCNAGVPVPTLGSAAAASCAPPAAAAEAVLVS